MAKFYQGNVVTIKSGGRKMTVAAFCNRYDPLNKFGVRKAVVQVRCIWHDDEEGGENFDIALLKLVRRDKDDDDAAT